MNFLLTKKESILHVLDFFHKLEKATGATINLEKNKVLPINTDQTNYIQEHITNITKLEQHQYIKILGISFSEGLKETILVNWQIILTKMENHIKKLSVRQLSLYGKALLINTLILAKTTFLSNVLPIPGTITEKVHKNIFHYLWQNNVPEQIARKTLFLAKNKRDLNLKEPEAHNLPMQIKYLLSLKQKEKQPPWMHIATYWLGRHIITIKIFNISKVIVV